MWWLRVGFVLSIALLSLFLVRSNKAGRILTLLVALALVAYLSLIIVGGVNQWRKETQPAPPEQMTRLFIEEMNPDLHRKIGKIHEEIVLAEAKIGQLRALRKTFPRQSELIMQQIHQWQALKDRLLEVSSHIESKVETAYVSYRINEIQGRKSFDVLSEELLTEANRVLENAETTKTVIEEQTDR